MPASSTKTALVGGLLHRYVTPYAPVAVASRTRKRVSNRRLDAGTPLVSSRSKCWIQTVPDGTVQKLVARKVNRVDGLVMQNQRVMIALSAHCGTLTS